MAPKRVEPVVRHFQYAANIGWLAAVEEYVCRRSIGVATVAAFEKAERDSRIEKIKRRPGMQADASAERVERFGSVGQFGEDAHFDGAEKDFRGPEPKANL
jgi:hypothetical protein